MIINDQSKMPFGRYVGWQLDDIPANYFLWLYEHRKFSRDLRVWIEDNMIVLKRAGELSKREFLKPK